MHQGKPYARSLLWALPKDLGDSDSNANFFLDTGPRRAIMNALDMNTPNETSLTKAADPVSVFMSSNGSRLSGSVAFNGLEKGVNPVACNPDNNSRPDLLLRNYWKFWPRVNKTDQCWLWTGAKNNFGYGYLERGGRTFTAHRFAYEELVGAIPAGLQLDHLCRNRLCVRPEHLEPVTQAENLRRSHAYRRQRKQVSRG